jgi:hypothetical protein
LYYSISLNLFAVQLVCLILSKQFFAAIKQFSSNFVSLLYGFTSYFYIIMLFWHLLGIVWLYLLSTFTYLILLSQLEFDSWQGWDICLFPIASRLLLGAIQPPIQWVTGAPYMGVKQHHSLIHFHGMGLIN